MKQNRKQSLYSKYTDWCARCRLPLILIPAIIFMLLGVGALIVYGALTGWQLAPWFTSSSAYLVYACTGILIVFLLYKMTLGRRL